MWNLGELLKLGISWDFLGDGFVLPSRNGSASGSKWNYDLNKVIQDCNPGIQKVESGGYVWAGDYPGLYIEPLS